MDRRFAEQRRAITMILSWMTLAALLTASCPMPLAAEVAGPLQRDPSAARVKLTKPTVVMYGYSDSAKDRWDETFETANVVTGETSDAELVKRLRAKGVVFACHVTNSPGPGLQTVDDFVRAWSAPFRDTLGGKLPGGFDAISIDELHSDKDGSPESARTVAALRQLRQLYPNRIILAWGVWKLAAGGGVGRYSTKDTYDDQLCAARDFTDQFLLECYQREGNPQFELFRDSAENLNQRAPGLLEKTVLGLQISQSEPFVADDDKTANFSEFLDAQFHVLRNDSLVKTTQGVAFWAFYRAKPETIQHVNTLVRHYFIEGKSKYYGSGRWK